MKTAVQEVFSDLEKLHPQLFNIYTTEGKFFINHFHKYLKMEKEQMRAIFAMGMVNGINIDFENYYNETFKKIKQ